MYKEWERRRQKAAVGVMCHRLVERLLRRKLDPKDYPEAEKKARSLVQGIRGKFLTGEYTQQGLADEYGMTQPRIRYLLSHRLSFEEEDVEIVSEQSLKKISRDALRKGSVPRDELVLLAHMYLQGGWSQSTLGKEFGLCQAAVSWRLKHPRIPEELRARVLAKLKEERTR